MFKEIGRVVELLKYPQSIILGLDKVAHINSDDLTLTIASEECAELIQSITKVKRYGFHDKYEENLHEEVADVLICIAELVCLGYLDIDKVRDYQKLKINRKSKGLFSSSPERRLIFVFYFICTGDSDLFIFHF